MFVWPCQTKLPLLPPARRQQGEAGVLLPSFHILSPPSPAPVGSAAVSKGAWLGLAQGSLQHPLAWQGQEDVSPVAWPGRTLTQNAAGVDGAGGLARLPLLQGKRHGYPSHTLPLLGLRVCGKLALDSLGWR